MYSSIEKIVRDAVRNKYIYGAIVSIQSRDSSINYTVARGYLHADTPYYIASINKLMIGALTLRLISTGVLNEETRILDILGDHYRGMHRLRGVDHTSGITVKHLLAHTSGLPCYLIDRDPKGITNMQSLLNGRDDAWPLSRVVREMQARESKFIPGTGGKANYAETNYRLLAEVLRQKTGSPVSALLEAMFLELGMEDSGVLPSSGDVAPVRYTKNMVPLSRYWSSTGADVVSTAADQMLFLRAFFEGHFFPEEKMAELRQWKKVFFPYEYGVGLQRLKLPAYFSPFSRLPVLEGHCGSAGSFAFLLDNGYYITGTINQAAANSLVVRMLLRICRAIKSLPVTKVSREFVPEKRVG